ncbi:hypothetical protein ACT80S_08185 [Ramlibacter sp. MAHUQ-53]|uniref:hypothetical protein n=1 Tax=unclassified Ramlibacter TaxID=2617605 RepID=UPI003645527F
MPLSSITQFFRNFGSGHASSDAKGVSTPQAAVKAAKPHPQLGVAGQLPGVQATPTSYLRLTNERGTGNPGKPLTERHVLYESGARFGFKKPEINALADRLEALLASNGNEVVDRKDFEEVLGNVLRRFQGSSEGVDSAAAGQVIRSVAMTSFPGWIKES